MAGDKVVQKSIDELFSFIQKSPTAFHAIDTIRGMLDEQGFEELMEGKRWDVFPGGKYYVTRNGSSIIAFKIGNDLEQYCFRIVASHSDSPTFKIKENAEIAVNKRYTKLNTEGYGGMICSSWFDRPLSLAGRVVIKEGQKYVTKLVNLDRDLLMIPNVAIHMNRTVNEGFAYNKQIDLLPLISGKAYEQGMLRELIAKELSVLPESIYGMDLFLYNRTAPCKWGTEEEFISCPQLDDLECAYTSLQGFLNGENDKSVQVYACFDNEEVGSLTKQGAGSTFLCDVLTRINRLLGKDEEDYLCALASSFMLSCDNAHAVHPNHPEKTDMDNCVYMNEGIVIKSHAGQKYTTDALSGAVFKGICEASGVPVQYFANRSDMAGGSTLGNIAMSQVSVHCLDIGLAQLAMHSCYETAGVKDVDYMIRAVTGFYNTEFCGKRDDSLEVRQNDSVAEI